ncbi:MAG TPA: PilN domain-containing protein [Candidatus Xenobia bacterium]|nr:PilN domain-containing protein [Candidatus Xenobia bacterium]
MIRINLAVERARPKVKRRVAVPGAFLFIVVLLALVIGLGVLAGFWYAYSKQEEDLRAQKAQLEAKRAQLAMMEKQIKDFEAKKAELDGRINVINTLKANQTGPVHMLEALADTVSATETLWLTSMVDKGNDIELKGMAGSVEAVAMFITNLSRSTYFKNVEIKEAVQKTTRDAPPNFEFTLTVTFALPQAAPAAAPAATTPPAPAGRQG